MTAPRLRVEGEHGLHWALELYPWPMSERGWCAAPTADARVIRVARNLPPQELLEVVAHEVLHACAWSLDEEVVSHYGEEVAKALLWALEQRGLALVRRAAP